MAFNQPPPKDRRPSPLLSNNPFRTRVPPAEPSPTLPIQKNRPMSSNPFLDNTELEPTTSANMAVAKMGRASPEKKGATTSTTELFDGLNINDKPTRQAPPPQSNGFKRPENVPPRAPSGMPPPGHRSHLSEEDRKRLASRPRDRGQLNIFADPSDTTKPRERRPRRNSETSVREKMNDLLGPDDDKRRQERRRREEKRHGKKPARKLDIIDKLDVTSIYGTGLFHHDGPFDACNPNRNRKGHRAAPMQAFPKDSQNMSLGRGYGPNNSKLNLEQIHGTGAEAQTDFNSSAVVDGDAGDLSRPNPARSASFHPTARVEPLHGEESAGLGTSTFLEGAPASRAAMQRRESEIEEPIGLANGGGLSRKKSLAQKIRGFNPNGRVTSPEPRMTSPTSPLATGRSENRVNPFFKDYDTEYDKKGQQIAEAEKMGRARAPSSPRRGLGLERKMTSDSSNGADLGKSSGGFLSRVKSLKGGPRKPRAREVTG